MAMTMVEKILADHSGRKAVSPGDLVNAKVDVVMCNDITAPIAINEFRKLGVKKVFDPSRVMMVMSHYVPAKDIASAAQARTAREFAAEQGCVFYEAGKGGIEHILLPQEGQVVAGDIEVGADSHTTTVGALGALACGFGSTDAAIAMATGELWFRVPPTIRLIYHGKPGQWVRSKDLILYTIGQLGTDHATYMCMQFEGEALKEFSMDARFTITNMVAEAGGKCGVIPVDDVTLDYMKPRAKRPWKVYDSDADAEYVETFEWDISEMGPLVAKPFSPDNVVPVAEVADEKVKIDQVFIGSCTNARLEDLQEAAAVMKGNRVADHVRCIIIPATQEVYRQALHEGLIDVFMEAGATVGAATCGPCLGGYMGVLDEGEKCVSTSNRNFPGRMGHVKSETYLVNPSVAAASAVLGRVAHPGEVLANDPVAAGSV